MPAPDPTTSRFAKVLLLVVAACLVGSLYGITLARSQSARMSNDETVYLDSARQIAATGCPLQSVGAGSVFLDNPPLVPFATALARWTGATAVSELRSASVTLWSLSAYVGTFLLASRLFGLVAGATAVASLFSQRRFLISASFVELDVPLAALSMFFLYSLYLVVNSTGGVARRRAGIACATLIALALWTKYQAVLLPLMGLAYIVFTSPYGPLEAIRKNWRPGVGMLAGAGVAVVAWYSLATSCGGDLFRAIDVNMARLTFETNEPWFHQPLLGRDGYWWNLARMLGPALVGGSTIAAALWGRRWFNDPRLKLLGLWILINLVFCSAIGLRSERYFFSASLAIAVMVGSLASREAYQSIEFLRTHPAWAKALRMILVASVIVYSALGASQFVAQNDRLQRQSPNSDYETLADVVGWTIEKSHRLLTTSPQVAYLADRNYYVSHWEASGARWLKFVADPANRIELIVFASKPTLHPNMSDDDRERVARYIGEHFATVPVDDVKAQVLRRVSF